MVSDGLDPTRRYRIAVAVTIAGSEITFDFSDTDDQAPGFTNMPAASAIGAIRIAFLMLLAAGGLTTPTNHGLFAPVHTVFRKGSLLDPRFPASTIFGNQMCDEVLEAIMRALADVLPDRVTAGWNQYLCTALTAIDPRTNEPSVSLTIFQRGGPGAMRGADGYDALGFTGTPGSMRSPDMEMFELSTPHLVHYCEYLPDSAGHGEWRGGYGTRSSWTFYGEGETGTTIGDDVAAEGADPAEGLFGGGPGGLNELRLRFPDGSTREWGSKEIIEHIPPGTVCEAVNGGGGGYGDARRRDPELVLAEVRDGLLSPDGRAARLRRRADRRRAVGRRARDGPPAGTRGVSYRIGIDVGGTFTDFLLVGDGVRLVHKTSSTPDDPSRGFVTGLAELAARLDLTLEGLVARLDLIVHGTTVTTNAVLTHSGARTGLLVTEGFRDTLALRDGTREDPYDNRLAPPDAARAALPAAARPRPDRLQGRRARAARARRRARRGRDVRGGGRGGGRDRVHALAHRARRTSAVRATWSPS